MSGRNGGLAGALWSLVLLAGCRDAPPAGTAAAGDFAYETVVTGLAVPWAIEFAPDGRVFVSERPGRIRVLRDWKLEPVPWATIDVVNEGEAGLLGLALSPSFARDGYVYAVGTFYEASRIFNRVIRLHEQDGKGIGATVLIDNIPAAEFHAGDAIEFGPDGMLYIATGDAGVPKNAADPASLSGKILRYMPDGTIPPDNPTPGSPVYASGLRNVQGLAWDKRTGRIIATEHGPSGFPNERLRRNNDELNAIIPGRNYGWPDVAGESNDAAFVPPLTVWSPAIAPSGVAVYDGPIAGWKGSAFVGGLRGQQLRRVALTPDAASRNGYRVTADQALFREKLGRIRAVTMGPDGHLYFATSNWDGRGDPRDGDDRILRLVPK